MATCLAGQASHKPPIVSLHRRFSRLSGRLKPQSRKRLRIFPKIWVFQFQKTQFGACFALQGLFQDSFKKLFNFPSLIVTVHCLVCSSPSQTHHVLTKILHFLHHLFVNLQEKGMDFLIFS